MSTTYTTNYHLGKQEDTSDNFNMSVITDNMDTIDSVLGNKSDKSSTYTKTEVDAALSAKQNTISDLATIRSGAALGATAVQPVSGKGLSTNDFTNAEKTKLDNHVIDTNNPHQVTKEQVGLGNVDNVATKDVLAEFVDSGAKNLLKNDAVSQSTVVVNPDGTMTINGTNSGTVNLEISVSTVLPPGDYVLSSDDIVSNVYLTARIATGGAQYTCTGQTKSVSFHLDDETQIERIYLFINSGTAISNLTVKPMICTKAAWDISQKYVPYRPSYDELIARVEALEQAAGINSVRNMVNLTTETVVDTTETEGEELR